MISTCVDDKWLDWSFTKIPTGMGYTFRIGDILIGQIFRGRNWTAVSMKTRSKLCPVEGFKTRYHAAKFLLGLNGYDA